MRHAYEGLITASLWKPSGPEWDIFAQRVVEKLKDKAFKNEDNPPVTNPKEASMKWTL